MKDNENHKVIDELAAEAIAQTQGSKKAVRALSDIAKGVPLHVALPTAQDEKRLVADVPASLYWKVQARRIERRQTLKQYLLDVLAKDGIEP